MLHLTRMATRPRVSRLDDHLGYWLRFVSNHVSQAFASRVAAHGVSVAEWVLMRQLFDEQALAPSRLAERLGMTRGGITRLADRLIGRALLERRGDPGDGRGLLLVLTAEGRALVPKLAALADENDNEFFKHLSPSDRATLRRILEGVVERRGLSAVPIQ